MRKPSHSYLCYMFIYVLLVCSALLISGCQVTMYLFPQSSNVLLFFGEEIKFIFTYGLYIHIFPLPECPLLLLKVVYRRTKECFT